MKIKAEKGEILFGIFNAVLLTFLMLITLYPMLHVLFASLSNSAALMAHSGVILSPIEFSISSYGMVFKNPMIVRGYLNTIFIVVAGVFVNILMTSLGAYFLSRKNVLWQTPITLLIIFTMFFNGGMVPFYLTVKNLGLYNSYFALILPTAINTYNMIVMRTAFSSIPESLVESAKIDGANHITILWRIVMPLSQAVVAVMVLYYGVAHWNSWFHAMLFIKDRTKFPLQIILREILIQNTNSEAMISVDANVKESVAESIKYATIVVATLPILCIYPMLQKYFIKGVMIGAVKG